MTGAGLSPLSLWCLIAHLCAVTILRLPNTSIRYIKKALRSKSSPCGFTSPEFIQCRAIDPTELLGPGTMICAWTINNVSTVFRFWCFINGSVGNMVQVQWMDFCVATNSRLLQQLMWWFKTKQALLEKSKTVAQRALVQCEVGICPKKLKVQCVLSAC